MVIEIAVTHYSLNKCEAMMPYTTQLSILTIEHQRVGDEFDDDEWVAWQFDPDRTVGSYRNFLGRTFSSSVF